MCRNRETNMHSFFKRKTDDACVEFEDIWPLEPLPLALLEREYHTHNEEQHQTKNEEAEQLS